MILMVCLSLFVRGVQVTLLLTVFVSVVVGFVLAVAVVVVAAVKEEELVVVAVVTAK